MSDEDSSDRWDIAPTAPAKAGPEAVERWQKLRAEIIAVARQFGWNKTEVAKRAGIPGGTFWQWFDGTYNGVLDNQSERVARWLAALKEQSSAAARVPAAPEYLSTPTGQKVEEALIFAQMMPEMVVVTLGAGMGKTMVAESYCATRPHAWHVTMRPTTSSVNNMLRELCEVFAITERDPAKLDRAIGLKLKRNGRHTLLVIDEAQNLTDQAVNQLRSYLDLYGVGIALLGNEELYGRFGGASVKPAFAQLHSRFGLRVRQMQPVDGDIDALLDAWGLEQVECRRLMHAVGKKPGALRHVTKVLQLAHMYALGAGRELGIADIRAAIVNRGLGD